LALGPAGAHVHDGEHRLRAGRPLLAEDALRVRLARAPARLPVRHLAPVRFSLGAG